MDATVLAVVVLLTALFLLCKHLGSGKKKMVIPGPNGFQIISSALQLKPSRIHEQFFAFATQYGEIFKIKIFNNNIVVLNSVDFVNKAFYRGGGKFNHRAKIFISGHLELQNSIGFRDYDTGHRNARKAFVKSLHIYGSGIIKFEIIVQRELSRLICEIDSRNENEFDVVSLIERSIINVMSILLIGEDASEDHVKAFRDITRGEDFFLSAGTNTLLYYLPFLLHLPYYKKRMEKTINAKRQLQDHYLQDPKNETSDRKEGFVSGLTNYINEEGGTLPDETINAIVITDVLSAGTLTTSATLSNILLCLANHPEHQKRLQIEIDKVIGQGRQPVVSDRHACSFTEAVILETMRYIPTGPFIFPHISKEDVEFEGYHVQANTQVDDTNLAPLNSCEMNVIGPQVFDSFAGLAILVNLWFILHDEKIWGDPWNFRPDRFLDENGKLLPIKHLYRKSLLIFSTGSRMCPGMGMAMTRMFLYLATLFQKYTFIPSPGKCGSCDPREGDFAFNFLVKPKPFYCVAKKIR